MKRGKDYIGVGVGAVIVDEEGKLLLALRGPEAQNQQNLWELPGGSVEFNERHQDALKREMHEEFGIEIAVSDLLDIVDDILPDERQHWISPNYICRIVSGQPGIQPGEEGKIQKFAWFRPEDVPENLTSVTRQMLADYRQRQE